MLERKLKNFNISVTESIALLEINRPQVLNAMNSECWEELNYFMDYAEQSDSIKVIVITGVGDRAFAAGADISALESRSGIQALMDTCSKNALEKIEFGNKPVVAAINGIAFGGGFELALACDIRVVAENAKLGFPEVNLGIMPGMGGTQRLVRAVGVGRAKEIIMAGKILSAVEAMNFGLALKVVGGSDLRVAAMDIAKTMATKAPLSLAMAKKIIGAALSVDQMNGLLMERMAYCVLMETSDKKEGIAAFKAKRKAEFKGI